MPICHQKKIIFIHIPRCGGNYIEKHLKMRSTYHQPLGWYKKNYPLEFKKYEKIIIVRHPIERFVSYYFFYKLIVKFNTLYHKKYPFRLIKNSCHNKKTNVNRLYSLKLQQNIKKKLKYENFNLSLMNIIDINSFVNLCYKKYITKNKYFLHPQIRFCSPSMSKFFKQSLKNKKEFFDNVKVFKFENYLDVLNFLNCPNKKKINKSKKTFAYQTKLTFNSLKKLYQMYKDDFVFFEYDISLEKNQFNQISY